MSNRDLTSVEKSIIRAIVADAGSKAVIEEILAIANEYVATMPKPEPAPEPTPKPEDFNFLRHSPRADQESWIVDGMTVGEVAMLVKIAEDECHDGDPTGPTWTTGICTCKADNAIVGSLSKKGYVVCVGRGREATIALTKDGLMAYQVARPNSDYARRFQK